MGQQRGGRRFPMTGLPQHTRPACIVMSLVGGDAAPCRWGEDIQPGAWGGGPGFSPCLPIGAAGWTPHILIGESWVPWVLIGAGWMLWVLIGAGWIPWMGQAGDGVLLCQPGLWWPSWVLGLKMGQQQGHFAVTSAPQHLSL